LQEANDLLAATSSKDIRSLRAQLERNAAVHVSEVKTLRNELQDTTSAVHDLRAKLDTARRAKSYAEEQRDKWKFELDELKTHSTQSKADLERRLVRETERATVLEDLVGKMEAEIERSTMSVKSGSDRMSVDIPHETEDEDDDDSTSPSTKHVAPGSPIQTLFAEMASMDNIDVESDDEMEDLPPGHYSSPQSPESSVSLPSISVATVLQSLRYGEEEEEIETVDRGVQTETPHTVPMIRVLSPTPPLINAPLMVPTDDVETVDQCTQTPFVSTITQGIQTDTVTATPRVKAQSSMASPTLKSPILRPQNSIRRGSHTVRWQEDKSIQAAPEPVKSAEVAIQTDPFLLSRALKPVLKTPTSETKELDNKETFGRHERLKSYDGPSRRDSGGGIAKIGPTRRFEGGNRGSMHFEQGSSSREPSHANGHTRHEKRVSGSHNVLLHSTHGRKVSGSQSHSDLRRGRQPHPSWMKARQQSGTDKRAPPPTMQLHNPTSLSSPSSPQPPLPIPQRTSSKFRVVLPIVRDRTVKEEALAEVAEVAEEVDEDSMDEEERTRREVAAFLARPPRKTVRQIRSAVTLRPGSSNDAHPPTPDHYHGEPSLTSQTPSQSPLELAQKSYSTPRRQPKRLVKLRPPTQETPASNLSPASSYFPTSEEMSVVDEIARCMVGEYMYKYVRRRRRGSFTWRRSPARSPSNLTEDVEDSTIRHKRWVWLQPYEKYILSKFY
jgi:hypothetical protein